MGYSGSTMKKMGKKYGKTPKYKKSVMPKRTKQGYKTNIIKTALRTRA